MADKSTAPSWNDPPPLEFDATASSSKPRLLRERVYTSLNKCEEPSLLKDCSKSSQIPPPITEKILPLNNHCTIPEINPKEVGKNCSWPDAFEGDQPMLTMVSMTLKNILKDHQDKCDERTTKEIHRRLDIMEKSWETNLSQSVKYKMFQLAQELCKEDIDAALRLHCILMVQNVHEVKNWMVGVKKIIEIKKENLKLSTIDNEELQESSICS